MTDINLNWRQVRIFTSDFSDQWYLGMLGAFAVPFAERYPNTRFWFTRYTDTRSRDGEDIGDTDIESLKPPYLDAKDGHASIRFRFCQTNDEESFLEGLFTKKFWKSDFRVFNAFHDFSTGRFGEGLDIHRRIKRVDSVTRLLDANCRFILDILEQENGVWKFEANGDNLNRFSKTPFHTMVHLISQVGGPDGTTPLPLYWIDPITGDKQSAAAT